jgi:hypothetical protein
MLDTVPTSRKCPPGPDQAHTAGLPGKGVLSVIFDRVLSDARGPRETRYFCGAAWTHRPIRTALFIGWAGRLSLRRVHGSLPPRRVG